MIYPAARSCRVGAADDLRSELSAAAATRHVNLQEGFPSRRPHTCGRGILGRIVAMITAKSQDCAVSGGYHRGFKARAPRSTQAAEGPSRSIRGAITEPRAGVFEGTFGTANVVRGWCPPSEHSII